MLNIGAQEDIGTGVVEEDATDHHVRSAEQKLLIEMKVILAINLKQSERGDQTEDFTQM